MISTIPACRFILGGLVASVAAGAFPATAAATSAKDRTIVPGVRIGAIYGLSTPAQLRRLYGRNLVMKRVYAGEGTYEDGAILFQGTPSELKIYWRDGKTGVRAVEIPRRGRAWTVRSKAGPLRVGSRIGRVVKANGRHFRVERENDGHNCTTRWRGGRLSTKLLVCFRETRKLGNAQSNRISRYKGFHSRLKIVGQTFVIRGFTVFLDKTKPPKR